MPSPFPLLNADPVETAIEPFVTGILEYGIIKWLNHARSFCSTRQSSVMQADFLPKPEPLFFRRPVAAVIGLLLQLGLDCEIGLRKRNRFFAGIRILRDQVAGIATELDIFDGSFGTRADDDHFGDVNEMVFRLQAAVHAGYFCLFQYQQEISEIRIFQQVGKIARQPVFGAILLKQSGFFKGSEHAQDSLLTVGACVGSWRFGRYLFHKNIL